MSRLGVLALLVTCVIVVNTMPANAGVTHTHKHEKHNSKERLKDGIYAARDAHHHEDGEHNVEFDHEAIIGSIKEAQEFDKLSPEESKKRLLVLIKLMDLNKDGFVERHELKAWILRSFKKLGEEEAADRMEEIDADGDYQITWKEYLKDSFSMEDEEEKKELIDFDSYDEEKQMIKSDKELFNAADLNKDGVLDSKEYVLFYSPEEHPQMLPIVLEHTLREKDTNHNGEIDYSEFIGTAGQERSREWLVEEKDRFDHLDENKDGLLTGNEVLNWVVPNSEAIAKDEVDHLFVSTDEDHDDRLSYLEILSNYDTFVGSEATDYGDHLQNINHFLDEL
ncbi:reticulocalbin-2 [Rhagoletis pomonella]|uniref:reticulocalbin-2 n=1 Tax=Rhagoletis pomonella TaxID=28610 RepID=UPI001785D34F|nr:reticulocalbin-2 [Rhagoletis pomonella]